MPSSAGPEDLVDSLFCYETGAVPVAREQRFASEELAEGGIRDADAFKVAVGHDVQQRLQRRAGELYAAIVKVVQRHAALRVDNRVDPFGEHGLVLHFRAKQFQREDRAGHFKDAAQETIDEQRRDAVAKAAGEHGATVDDAVLQLLQEAVA
jgi:hypothetical protein